MSQPQADRSLMLGLLALKTELVDRETLLTALTECIADKTRSLDQVLLERGNLDTEKFKQLETLVATQIAGTGRTPFATLAGDLDTTPATAGDRIGSLNTLAGDSGLPTLAEKGPVQDFQTVASNAYETIASVTSTDPTAASPAEGDSRFQILRPYAKGGLGQVSVALDKELDRSVAIKEIQDRYADHPVSRARFIEEAEITGKLEHPGVIPVYSLGHHPDGRPYYAMRFVKGDSLKKAIQQFHADESLKLDPGERSLKLRELLARFLDVCNAIAYAHSRGVLHRDLKPDNILLGPYGETLVVDWGLAKSVDKDSDPSKGSPLDLIDGPIRLSAHSGSRADTIMGSAIGTPAYMSPEQAEGKVELMGQGTDVYGLGATLYHLLTGKVPVEGGTLGEILRRVKEGHFPSARTVDPTVPPGLDAICSKALANRPLDRYPTVEAMADDIKRWLADESVTAHRESAVQRLKRWFRKHPTFTAAGSVLVLAGLIGATIIVGIVARKNVQIALKAEEARKNAEAATASAAEARLNEAEAERNLQAACIGTDSLLTEVADVDLADIPQMEPVRRRLLEKAMASYRKFLEEKKDTPILRWVVGRAHGRLGDILEMMGKYRDSEKDFAMAVVQLAALSAEFPGDASYRGDLIRGKLGLGVLYKKTNRFKEAESELREASELCRPLAASIPEPYLRMQGDIDYQLGALWAKSKAGVGVSTADGSDRERAGEEAYRRAVEFQRVSVDANRGKPDQQAKLGRTMNNLAMLLSANGRIDEADRLLREAIDLVKGSRSLPGPRWQYARASHNLGVLLLRPGSSLDANLSQAIRSEEGLKLLREARGILEKLSEEFPTVPQYQQELASVCLNLARVERVRKLDSDAQRDLEKSLSLDKRLVEEFPEIPDYRLAFARGTLEMATNPGLSQGQPKTAEGLATDAIKQLEILSKDFQTVPDYRNELGLGYASLARILTQSEQWSPARNAITRAIEHQQAALNASPRNKDYLTALRNDRFIESVVLRNLGDLEQSARSAEEIVRLTPDELIAYYRAATLLAECFASAGEHGDGYARRAVIILEQAVRKRLIQDISQLRVKEFSGLKDRDDFRRLIGSLDPSRPA